jgi:hypothetical protein
MVEPGEVIIALGAFTAFTVSVTVVARTVLRIYENRHRGVGSGLHPETTARIERIEQAVDAIAIEIERISEGQRFTTRLLSDRIPSGR